MMAQKHLHELLKEDQEPFLLKNYISDRRNQLERPSQKTTLQVKKHKPIHQNSNFPTKFCKNACFFSFHDTPDIRKSPLFEFSSPSKSPCRSPNTIFLHIPARTTALLLEAALRIQKHSKPKPPHKNNGFGLLGSLFKRLTQKNSNKKMEIEGDSKRVSVKDILRFDSSVGRRKEQENMGSQKSNDSCEVGFHCSCNGRPSSAVWSESNEDKSLDMETSTSSHSCDSEENEFVAKEKENEECACFDNDFFCESPFRFVLQRSPSSGHRTPEFSSPATSPTRRRTEDKESNGADSLNKLKSREEEEDKEQCSPVSVLDPPFEDDDDVHENDDEEDGIDLECSYAIVQRTKQRLLHKLRRFEKLAELDPVELEKRMLDQEDNEDGKFIEEDNDEDDDSETSCKEEDLREIVFEVLGQSSVHNRWQVPEDLRRLVYDLLMEEERELNSAEDRGMVIRRVCRRLELWKEVESNTIDMMIEEDFSREEGGWKKNSEQIRELAGELELAIFGFLVEEFLEELVC